MAIRVARLNDIPDMHSVRLGVRENVLRDRNKVTPAHYRAMLEERGRGWVYERDGEIGAFGIADQLARNIWALFVSPQFEEQGIGRSLLRTMVEWLCQDAGGPIWLTTEPRTRAEQFYRSAGWQETGITEAGEIRFELRGDCADVQADRADRTRV
jgi:GNAT superfamily N-acetyltransferase